MSSFSIFLNILKIKDKYLYYYKKFQNFNFFLGLEIGEFLNLLYVMMLFS